MKHHRLNLSGFHYHISIWNYHNIALSLALGVIVKESYLLLYLIALRTLSLLPLKFLLEDGLLLDKILFYT